MIITPAPVITSLVSVTHGQSGDGQCGITGQHAMVMVDDGQRADHIAQ